MTELENLPALPVVAMLRLLCSSWRDVNNQYDDLTAEERGCLSRGEHAALVRWLGALSPGGDSPLGESASRAEMMTELGGALAEVDDAIETTQAWLGADDAQETWDAVLVGNPGLKQALQHLVRTARHLV